jgi:hypothetical protein
LVRNTIAIRDYLPVALLWRSPRSNMKAHRNRVSRNGHTRANFLSILIQAKLIALEVAATIIFFVWLYRELIHELKN